MDKEEAKQIISDIDRAWRNFSQKEYVALEMAIKALSSDVCKCGFNPDFIDEEHENGALQGIDTGRLDGKCEDVIPIEDAIAIVDSVYNKAESEKNDANCD